MSQTRFIRSIAANIAYWRGHEGLADPQAWQALDRERGNLFRAVEYGLRQPKTWPGAAELALQCYTYIFERGYWSEWALVIEQALGTGRDENALLRGRLVQQLGSLYRKLRHLDDAQAAHEQAMAIGRALDDPQLVAMARLGLGRVHYRRRAYDDAENNARLALVEFESHDVNRRELAYTYVLLGIIAIGRGNCEESASELYRARDLFRAAQEPIELGRACTNLMEALSRLGRVDEALLVFEEAAAIFKAYDLQLEGARLNANLGFMHYSQGNLDQAETAFRQAYSPAMRRVGPIYLRSLIEMNLGNVLLLQGHAEESRIFFLNAVSGFRLVGSQIMLANSLDGLAETTLAAGSRDGAIAHYEEALAIVTAIPGDAFASRMEKRFRGLLKELHTDSREGQ